MENTTSSPIYRVKCLGRWAHESLMQEGDARIIGVISQGIYVLDVQDRVFFLTGEVFCGPITINLNQRLDYMTFFTIGDVCRISNDRLLFPGCQVLFSRDTPIWTPPLIKFAKSGLSIPIFRGRELVKAILGRYETGLFFPFLEKIAEEPENMDEEIIRRLLPGL